MEKWSLRVNELIRYVITHSHGMNAQTIMHSRGAWTVGEVTYNRHLLCIDVKKKPNSTNADSLEAARAQNLHRSR